MSRTQQIPATGTSNKYVKLSTILREEGLLRTAGTVISLGVPDDQVNSLVKEIRTTTGLSFEHLDTRRIWSNNTAIVREILKFLKARKIPHTKEIDRL